MLIEYSMVIMSVIALVVTVIALMFRVTVMVVPVLTFRECPGGGTQRMKV